MQDEYFQRVWAAVSYIEENLREELSLPAIAAHAGYSPFHFCRIFQGMTGEAVMDYVRKRRLTQAACALVTTRRRILDIAVDYQYDSQEAFTRSFKRAFGMTPGAFRRRGMMSNLRCALTLTKLMSPCWKGAAMEPRFVTMGPMTVVGMEYIGKNENMEIPALWSQFNPRCGEVQHKAEPMAALGVCGECRDDGSFSYVAGFAVSNASDVPDGMVVKHIPAATYAVFTHRGPLLGVEHDLQATYGYVYREWLPNSGYTRTDSPEFEWYDERFAFGEEGSEMDIYIPVVRNGE